MIAAIHALVLTLALAVPYVAHGECAWVLWSQSPEGYTVVGAHPTVRDCAVATTETVMALQQQGFTARSVPGESPKDVEVIVRKVLHGLLVERGDDRRILFCLPDTVDPRGPKGK